MEVATYNAEPHEEKQIGYDLHEMQAFYYEYKILKCPKCECPFIQRNEFLSHWEVGVLLQEENVLYPYSEKMVKHLPKEVFDSFKEARLCLAAQSNTACVIMCRKALELTCKDRLGINRKYYELIEKMRQEKEIDEMFYEWFTHLRVLGNDAAHDTVSISREDAEACYSFTASLLQYIYELRVEFENFKQEKA